MKDKVPHISILRCRIATIKSTNGGCLTVWLEIKCSNPEGHPFTPFRHRP